MPDSSDVQRWVIPAILLASVIGVLIQLWWERRRPTSYPGSRAHRAALRSVAGDWQMAWWAVLPTEVQARHDAEAIAEGMLADGFDQAVRGRVEESARLAVQRAAESSTLPRP